jgi:hypothetical protein
VVTLPALYLAWLAVPGVLDGYAGPGAVQPRTCLNRSLASQLEPAWPPALC